MNLKMLHDKIAVRPIKPDSVTEGGIIIPDIAQDSTCNKGEVIAVGPGNMRENGQIYPLEYELGNIILYGKWTGTELTFNGEKIIIIKDSDVLAIVE